MPNMPSAQTNKTTSQAQPNRTRLHKFQKPRRPFYEFKSFLEPLKYTQGSIISVVGPPKSGKTTYSIQEILFAQDNGECLIMYNESPRDKYMYCIQKQSDSIGIPVTDNIWFADMNGLVLHSANYDAISKFVDIIIGTLDAFLAQASSPKLIVIDSLSKFCRTYTAQSFYFAQDFNAKLELLMEKHKKYPVVLEINQKSGGHWERDDESVLGGYGIVHEMDGSVVFRTHYIDKPFFSVPVGSWIHTVQQTDLRYVDVEPIEYMTRISDSKVIEVVGPYDDIVLRRSSSSSSSDTSSSD